MKKLTLLAALLLTACGGGSGGEQAPIENPPIQQPELKTYCVEIYVKYTTDNPNAKRPIQDLYGVAYPQGSNSINLDGHIGSGWMRYPVKSTSSVFAVDLFMFGKFHSTKQMMFTDNDVVGMIDIDTLDGAEGGTSGAMVSYGSRFRYGNQLCSNF